MSGSAHDNAKPLVDSEWPDRLRRGVSKALLSCQIGKAEWHARELDVHHIVAAKLEGALPGRRSLARWSISAHSIVNAAIVPRVFHQGQGLHRQEFLHMINLRLSSAEMFAEAIMPHGGFTAGRLIMMQAVQKIGIELVAHSGDAAAIRLQGALQALVIRSTGGGSGGLRSDVGGRTSTRNGQQGLQTTDGAVRIDSVVVPRPRRPRLQHAAACP